MSVCLFPDHSLERGHGACEGGPGPPGAGAGVHQVAATGARGAAGSHGKVPRAATQLRPAASCGPGEGKHVSHRHRTYFRISIPNHS